MRRLSYILISFSLFFLACGAQQTEIKEVNDITYNADFNDYWFKGKAEITSYTLQQARYGEIHPGHAVLVFVTEDFLVEKQVKKEYETQEKSIPVLKLNFMKNFTTGIYPYSIMTSVFSPIQQESYSEELKITTSSQEWCGHTWFQLNRKSSKLKLQAHSYFEKEGEQIINLKNTLCEDGIWNNIRMNPEQLPLGKIEIIPSSQYLRLSHHAIQAFPAFANISDYQGDEFGNNLKEYHLYYPELERNIWIYFSKSFPYTIEAWKESYASILGAKTRIFETTAIKKVSIYEPYWQLNHFKDSIYRAKLKLD